MLSTALALSLLTLTALPEGLAEPGDFRLRLEPPALLAADEPAGSAAAQPAQPNQPAAQPNLDFDLLGTPTAPQAAPAETSTDTVRRSVLKVHQGIGIGLLGVTLATEVVGVLNYWDRFGGGGNSGRYMRAHAALAYSSATLFAVNGLIALLAPESKNEVNNRGLDHVKLHAIGMFTAAAGIAAEIGLGVATANHEGLMDQKTLATTHLVIGLATYVATALGVSAIIF